MTGCGSVVQRTAGSPNVSPHDPVNWLRRLAVDTTPLQVPAFKRLFLGTVVTVIGTQMTLVAVPVQAYLLTPWTAACCC